MLIYDPGSFLRWLAIAYPATRPLANGKGISSPFNLIMARKAIIFDLDNTIYAVSSIADQLFAPLFKLLKESGEVENNFEEIKRDLMRKPFQLVARKYGLTEGLTQKGTHLLQNMTYEGEIRPFDDYRLVRALPVEKFLVTTGFLQLQQSKIERMGIRQDFREVHIVDIESGTKKEVFAALLQRHHLRPSDVLVVGDDPDSEIKAAQELDLAAVLYDKAGLYPDASIPRISDYRQLSAYL